jgi:hypothetical protein
VGADDIAEDFHASSHGTEPPPLTFIGGGGNDLGHGFTKASDPNWLPRLADLFQDAQAFGFEHGDGDFLPLRMTSI